MFSLICVLINGWVNNCETGDLSRYRTHYDVTAMYIKVMVHKTSPQIEWTNLWPSDAMWWHRSGTTLAQVMANCLTTPSITWTNVCLSSARSCGNHPRSLSWKDPKIPICKTRLKIVSRGQWFKCMLPHSDVSTSYGAKLLPNIMLIYSDAVLRKETSLNF